jgi:non-specific serine/threonine protein kinase
MIGTLISQYRIEEKVGEGGMGSVFRAHDTKLQRPVALKFLPLEFARDAAAGARLLKEARITSSLNHPNIATIYEVGDANGSPFIAMELVLGESLREVLDRGPLVPDHLLDIARQIADGLQFAHDAGILHRDLKPANIMIGPQGHVKILDFGLAVLTGRERAPGEATADFLTRSRVQLSSGGTVPYMPPEQLHGETTDIRGDIFSFGVLLYECLSGQYPFPGDNAVDVMHAIMHKSPVPLRGLVPSISKQWERNIERCLAKAPEERFDSVSEMRAAFREEPPQVEVEKSVAVLYFESLGGNEEDTYFRDGMTEDIITELSQIHGLRVFPRSAVYPFRDRPTTAPKVAQQLNARYVLEGSVRRAHDRLRITTHLVESASGHTTWSQRYDRHLEDVFAIQDEIANSIAAALKVVLTDTEKRAIEKRATENVQAYDYYLRGRKFFHEFRTKGFRNARQMFSRAIVVDPEYARAYAGVADCSSMLYSYGAASQENMDEADIASRKALQLDSELAEAHVSRGLAVSLKKNYAGAERAFDRAIRLDPNSFEAHYYKARICWTQGKLEQAADLFARASQLRPEDFQAQSLASNVYSGLGREEEATACRRRAVELARKHLETSPDDGRALYLGGCSLCELGETEEGLRWASRALEMDPDEPVTHYNVACLYSIVGKLDQAVECLRKAVDLGFAHKEWIEHDSNLDSLHGHPDYRALLASM